MLSRAAALHGPRRVGPAPLGGLKPPGTRRTPGALPESRWLGGEVRTALGSAIFPGNWWPRAVPSVPGSAPQPPARSIGMRWLHRRTAWTAAPRRTAPDRTRARPHASASSHRVHSQCPQRFSLQPARMRSTCHVRTSSQSARTYRVHVQREHPPVLTQRACTHDVHTPV